MNFPCAIPRDLTQLFSDIVEVIQTEYKNWTGSVNDYSKLAVSLERDYGEVGSLQNATSMEMADLNQTKAQLKALNNNGSALSQEEQTRVDRRLSSE